MGRMPPDCGSEVNPGFIRVFRTYLDAFGQGLGGVEEDRTPDLRIANAALSQLSYHPEKRADSTRSAGMRQIYRSDGSGGYNQSQ